MRIGFKLFFVFLLLCVLPFGVKAQDDRFINGVLLDADSGQPVVFATIRVRQWALGVVSNSDGGFKIPIDFQKKGHELEISCMGYEALM